MRGLGLGITNSGGTWGKRVCVLVGVGSGCVTWVWEGGWCYVCVCCEAGFFVLMAGLCICILC